MTDHKPLVALPTTHLLNHLPGQNAGSQSGSNIASLWSIALLLQILLTTPRGTQLEAPEAHSYEDESEQCISFAARNAVPEAIALSEIESATA